MLTTGPLSSRESDLSIIQAPRRSNSGAPVALLARGDRLVIIAFYGGAPRNHLERHAIRTRGGDPAATTCVQGKPLAPDSTCKIVVVYWPLAVTPKAQFDTATLEVTTNSEKTKPVASGGVIDVMLKGKGKPF